MYWHAFAWSTTLTDGASNEALTGVLDQAIGRDTASNFLLPEPMRLYKAYGGGVNGLHYRITSPTLRRVIVPSISPIGGAVAPTTEPPYYDWGRDGPILPAGESLSADASNSGAVAGIHRLLVLAGKSIREAPSLEIFTLRCTAAITGVVGAWAAGTIVPEQTLPTGTYNVVGATCVGANPAFFRINFAGGAYRPGWVQRAAATTFDWLTVRRGQMGIWGTFTQTTLPQLEVLVSGAQTAQVLFLDLQKVS